MVTTFNRKWATTRIQIPAATAKRDGPHLAIKGGDDKAFKGGKQRGAKAERWDSLGDKEE
ncbi:hypothetical protein ACLOJK_011044 [Asimina triloba]